MAAGAGSGAAWTARTRAQQVRALRPLARASPGQYALDVRRIPGASAPGDHGGIRKVFLGSPGTESPRIRLADDRAHRSVEPLRLAGGERAVRRVSTPRPSFGTGAGHLAAVDAEVAWCEALAADGIAVCEPVRAQDARGALMACGMRADSGT